MIPLHRSMSVRTVLRVIATSPDATENERIIAKLLEEEHEARQQAEVEAQYVECD